MKPMSVLLGVVLLAVPAAAARNDPPREPLPRHALARIGTKRVRPTLAIRSLVYSSDGKLLACGSYEDGVVLHDAGSGQRLRHLLRSKNIHEPQAAFSPDGKWVALTQGDAEIALHEASTGKHNAVLTVNDRCWRWPSRRIAGWWGRMQRSGPREAARRVCAGVGAGQRAAAAHLCRSRQPGSCRGLFPRRQALASGGNDVRVWDLASGRRALGFPRWMRSSHTLVFTSDSRMLIAPGYNAIVWDLTSGQEVKSFGEGEDGEQNTRRCPVAGWKAGGHRRSEAWSACGTSPRKACWRSWWDTRVRRMPSPSPRRQASGLGRRGHDGAPLGRGGGHPPGVATRPLARAGGCRLCGKTSAQPKPPRATRPSGGWSVRQTWPSPFCASGSGAAHRKRHAHWHPHPASSIRMQVFAGTVPARKELERYGKRAVPSLRPVLAATVPGSKAPRVRALLARHETPARAC